MEASEIIQYVKNLKVECCSSNDPGKVCEVLNIPIRKITLNPNIYPAYTTNINGKAIISLNTKYTLSSQLVLCAHELAHALLHNDNYYNGFDGENMQQEYEANLFAVAFIFSEEQYDEFIVPLNKMSNFELKSILDYNIKLNPNEI